MTSNSDLVRFSRDGDQFHYLWAARRCLLLLLPTSGPVAVTIEGASLPDSIIKEGEELIDVAEYYGSDEFNKAQIIKYIQLKHSTQAPNEPWTPSGLKKTIEGFANRFKKLKDQNSLEGLERKVEFHFITNRPINSAFLEIINNAACQIESKNKIDLQKLKKFTGLQGAELASFCKMLRFEGGQDNLWNQRNILIHEIKGYLPDADAETPIQLKELITRKALSESADNPTITRIDVLRALKTDIDSLYPAPCLIESLNNAVTREQESEIIKQIALTEGKPVIVHASGGIGKSIFSTRIRFNEHSFTVVYDCFGNGRYRSASSYRHRHREALVQISNELASKGLCHPLIPTVHADSSMYIKAFIYRLQQSIRVIRGRDSEALLCIVVDAADNAQMAAEELGESRSFARDLLREQMPPGVRLVMLCRTHRRYKLDPPPHTLLLELLPFTLNETTNFLKSFFPEATEHDNQEFHRLTSCNPRVQATALSRGGTLQSILRALGPNPKSVEDTIEDLFEHALNVLRDSNGPTEQEQINVMCAGLAVLRPLVPITVLSLISGVDVSAVRSFATDLGRPIVLIDDSIQFFDEPAETWFRKRFEPSRVQLNTFIELLVPLASQSGYVASSLPQILLAAEQFSRLVNLALSSAGLPENNPIEKRDVELQRLQFALKASLQNKKYTDAAKLALKAGSETAGIERQQLLLQSNTDLGAIFLDTNQIQELVYRRTFRSRWRGGHHVYESGLLSWNKELIGDARSRLRMASEWLRNWSKLPNEEREHEIISNEDIAELCMASFNIEGPNLCIRAFQGWRPREVTFNVGRILARRFIDHGRFKDLDNIALAAKNNLCIILALSSELCVVHRYLPNEVVSRSIRLLLHSRILLPDEGWDSEEKILEAITSIVLAGIQYSTHEYNELASILDKYLPDQPKRSVLFLQYGNASFIYLRAYSLRAVLKGQSIDLLDLAYPDLRKEIEADNNSDSRDLQELKVLARNLLPWHELFSRILLEPLNGDRINTVISSTKSSSENAAIGHYFNKSHVVNHIAQLWLDIISLDSKELNSQLTTFNEWLSSNITHVTPQTLTRLARWAGQQRGIEDYCLDYAYQAFQIIQKRKESAEESIDSYIELSRAVISVSKPDAEEYFNEAIRVASRIGEENLWRWDAILDLADCASNTTSPTSETAYQLARSAELTYRYVDRDKHFMWGGTVRAITGLCASSSLAIFSRWRDRDFGKPERLLPIAVHFLVEHQLIDPITALSLIGFKFNWDQSLLLQYALEVCSSISEKQVIINHLYHYMRLDDYSLKEWQEVKDLAIRHNLILDDIDKVIHYAQQQEHANQPFSTNDQSVLVEEPLKTDTEFKERDWNAIFKNVDFGSATDILNAHLRFTDDDLPNPFDLFLTELFKRVEAGKRVEFIKAYSEIPQFDLYELRMLLTQLPTSWSGIAVTKAIAKASEKFYRRCCIDVTRNRYYEAFPLKEASKLTGVSEGDIIDVVLSGIGETTEYLGTERLFSLIGLIVQKLSHSEAQEVLKLGLGFFDHLLEEDDGDGPWSEDLIPPKDIEEAIAGYIWAGLASPRASFRWEAAHVVRGLSKFDRKTVLKRLIDFADQDDGGVFVDKRLHFYNLHARQWFLISLARIAGESPLSIIPHATFLLKIALNEEHVLIREFASQAVLSLINTKHIEVDPSVHQQLLNVNRSHFPFEVSTYHERLKLYREQELPELDHEKFNFNYDFESSWLSTLGGCFAISRARIAREASQIIYKKWGYDGNMGRLEDERINRGIFKEGETYYRKENPRTDDLRFYLSYHAMMLVAGNLLEAVPVHKDPESLEDEFVSWLKDYGLTQENGFWLADRRDPVPVEWSDWKYERQENDWPWSVSLDDFKKALGFGDDRLNVWGGWSNVQSKRKESIRINSALVSSEYAESLLYALQTADNNYDYSVPEAGNDLDYKGFQLRGWVESRSKGSKIDEFDPWAANISLTFYTPAKYVLDQMGISSDTEHRIWYIHDNTEYKEVFWLEVWNMIKNTPYNEVDEIGGVRLQASLTFITELLRKNNFDLLLEVEIERDLRYSRYESRKGESLEYHTPYTKLFILKSNGQLYTL